VLVHERRRHRRVTFQVPATLLLGPERAPYSASLLDVGEGGMFVLMPQTIGIGKNVTVRWAIDASTVCEATGWVQRVMPFPQGQGIAIEFGIANDVLLHFLRNLIECAEAQRAHILSDIKDLVIYIT